MAFFSFEQKNMKALTQTCILDLIGDDTIYGNGARDIIFGCGGQYGKSLFPSIHLENFQREVAFQLLPKVEVELDSYVGQPAAHSPLVGALGYSSLPITPSLSLVITQP